MLVSMETGAAAKSRWSDNFRLEVMRMEWNSAVARLQETAAESVGRTQQPHTMPASVGQIDVDAFLREMAAARSRPDISN